MATEPKTLTHTELDAIEARTDGMKRQARSAQQEVLNTAKICEMKKTLGIPEPEASELLRHAVEVEGKVMRAYAARVVYEADVPRLVAELRAAWRRQGELSAEAERQQQRVEELLTRCGHLSARVSGARCTLARIRDAGGPESSAASEFLRATWEDGDMS